VRNIALASTAAAVLSLSAGQAFAQSPGAASRADLEAIQAQMQALVERMNRLEATNTQLQNENADLKAVVERREAETDYLKAQTRELREEAAVAANEISKVKGADWAKNVKVKGDLRYRHEIIDRDDRDEDQNRQRIRARLGVDAKVTDNILVALQVATGGDDPRSSNQTLGGASTRKSVGFDLAYADWRFAEGANLVLGKQKYPFVRPGQSLFYDGDFNPEGGAVTFNRGVLFGSAWGWWLSENSQAGDATVVGTQLGARFPFGDASNLMIAAQYYDLDDADGRSLLYNCSDTSTSCFNGNTATGEPGSQILAFDYNVWEVIAEFNTALGNLPLQAYVDYAQNTDPEDLNEAMSVGFLLGKAGNDRTWELGAAYQSIEKDALFGQFIDSDFADGKTDGEGWILRTAWVPVKNWTLNAQYFINTLNVDVGDEIDYDRLQLDLNYKF
jgi:cell division protein FtsB